VGVLTKLSIGESDNIFILPALLPDMERSMLKGRSRRCGLWYQILEQSDKISLSITTRSNTRDIMIQALTLKNEPLREYTLSGATTEDTIEDKDNIAFFKRVRFIHDPAPELLSKLTKIFTRFQRVRRARVFCIKWTGPPPRRSPSAHAIRECSEVIPEALDQDRLRELLRRDYNIDCTEKWCVDFHVTMP
jgi:hypothetical protein